MEKMEAEFMFIKLTFNYYTPHSSSLSLERGWGEAKKQNNELYNSS
jgi:hypothetical protein